MTMTKNEFLQLLKEKVEKSGKGYTLNVDDNRGLVNINGDNHLCMRLGDNRVEYLTVGGSRICYANHETFDECLENLDSKLLTNEEIDNMYRALFNHISKKEA